MSEVDSIQKVVLEITKAYKPLAEKASLSTNGNGIVAFVKEIIGWDLRNHYSDAVITEFTANVKQTYESLEAFVEDPTQIRNLISDLESFVSLVRNLGTAPSTSVPPELQNEFDSISEKILNYLIVSYIQRTYPLIHNVLVFIGIINVERKESIGPLAEYVSWEIKWDHISKLFTNPLEIFENIYHWNDPNFNPYKLFLNIRNLLWFLDIPAGFQKDDPEQLKSVITNLEDNPILRIPFFTSNDENGFYQAGLSLLPTKTNDGVNFEGIALTPFGSAKASHKVDIGNGWSFKLDASADQNVNYGIILSPPSEIRVDSPDMPGTSPKVRLNLELSKEGQGNKIILAGQADKSRLAASSFGIHLGMISDLSDSSEYFIEAFLNDGELIIKPEEDGFLQKILPEGGLQGFFDIVIGWSNTEGLYFKGSGLLEISIPINTELGPILFQTVHVGISFDDSGRIVLRLTADLGAKLGILDASVQKIGFDVKIKMSDSPSFSLDFVPPTGAGLTIDVAGLKGGGFLSFDNENKRYAGILDLDFKKIALTAIGLITTRMPDGSKGFSMLILITVQFDPPISLPYNFKLSGVGGLLGIKRSMNTDFLQDGLRKGTLDSIMFPEDPIVNAPRIISDMRNAFPPTEGRYVFGPLMKIDWGSPALMTGELGLFFEIPSPYRIVLLGQISAKLPPPKNENETKSLIDIRLDVLGILDFEKKSLSFDAAIDGSITIYKVRGDSALRLCWGDSPNFALSIGGLHPRYTPPPKFPTLRRLEIFLKKGSVRISFKMYMGVTSNSIQFGAHLDVRAGGGKFKLEGYMYFDALFIFSPFSFDICFGAGIAIKVGSRKVLSVSLDLCLSGPKPWRAKGKVKFKIFFVKITIRVDKSWGSGTAPELPLVDPWPPLLEAFKDAGNYAGILPSEEEVIASMRKLEHEPDSILVHPMGSLQFRQRVLPLNFTLERFGNAKPEGGPTEFKISSLQVGSTTIDESDLVAVKEYFARGQFQKLSNHDKLSKPSFEKLGRAGFLLPYTQSEFESSQLYNLEYETEVIDENKVAIKTALRSKLVWRLGRGLLKNSATMKSNLFFAGNGKYLTHYAGPTVRTNDERFVVVSRDDMTIKDEITSIQNGGITHAEADTQLNNYLRTNPLARNEFQVVPIQEAIA